MEHCWHQTPDTDDMPAGEDEIISLEQCCWCGKKRVVRYRVLQPKGHGKFCPNDDVEFEVLGILPFMHEECQGRLGGIDAVLDFP
jgi:hypothetical protein